MKFRHTSGNDLVVNSLWEWYVHQPIAMHVPKFAPANSKLNTSEAMGENFHAWQPYHSLADSLLRPGDACSVI